MVRKLLLIFLALLLICPSVEAAKKGIYTTVASGTVTQANMRLSGVDGGATASGGAFVDFGAANVLTTKIGHLPNQRQRREADTGVYQSSGDG